MLLGSWVCRINGEMAGLMGGVCWFWAPQIYFCCVWTSGLSARMVILLAPA